MYRYVTPCCQFPLLQSLPNNFHCCNPPSNPFPPIAFVSNIDYILTNNPSVYSLIYKVCRRLFFDQTVPEADIERYMGRLRADSRVTLDLSSLINTLPSITSMASDGKATWLTPSTESKDSTTTNIPSTMVLGAEKDFVVDRQGVLESGIYLGVEPEWVNDTYHDVMLGPKWTKSAELIAKWIDTLLPTSS